MCDHKQYTFFFWSPEFGEVEQANVKLTKKETEVLKTILFKERD